MERAFFHRLGSILWGALVFLVVMLAIYVSVGRFFTIKLTPWRTAILQEVNARVPFTVEAEQVSGQWQSFSPVIVLTGLRLSFPTSSEAPLELSEGRIGVDVLNSLRTASLQTTHLALTDLTLRGELSAEGKLRLIGFGDGAGEAGEELREFLLNVESIALQNNLLKLTMPSGEVRDLDLNLVLSREGSHRHAEVRLTSTVGAHIAIIAEGVGDPFQPGVFSGKAYLDIQSPDLGAVRELFVNRSLPVSAEGAVDLQLWLDWDKGHPAVEAQLLGRNLHFAGVDSGWDLPLDRVALQARLLKRKNRWTVFASDLLVVKDDVTLTLPRLQLDSWNKALRVRATDVPLAPLHAITADLESIPEALREVFATLHPRGRLSALQVSTDDTGQPARSWEFEANFEDVAVEPLKGAPGLSAAAGYTRLSTGGGIVMLDSQSLTLDFPTLYHQPLHFEDLYGTLRLNWDADMVSLASGLLTTQGEEGSAKVLFGLTIPLVPNDIGIEMDLLVGLQNSHPVHRVKYIPYVLQPTLLTWLSDSIGEGRIEQGAFLWRGSLTKGAAPLRTVQLAFNVADTSLSYHPQWPPVLVEKGVVLIDDAEVSVWADQASLFDSAVEDLSVETRLNESAQITLAVKGSVLGDASDGLKVLNESPLAAIVGQTFAHWTVAGELETELQLRMNLSDQSVVPWVDVATHWRDVNLVVMPGNLPVQAVNGEFNYNTTQGFSSRDLAGELWGKTVRAGLSHRHAEGADEYDPASSRLDVELSAPVEMADVRHWLKLESLAFVSGETRADVNIQLVPGEPPLMSVDSELQGVSLDLPQPWKKTADEARRMHLEVPLVAADMPLSLDIEQQLRLRLDIASGALRGGSLGINVEPELPQEGILHVSGHAPLIEGDQWLEFVEKYFVSDLSLFVAQTDTSPELPSQSGPPVVPVAKSDVSGERLPSSPINIVVDEVQADTLVLLNQELQDVVFSLALGSSGSNVSLDTDWLRGDLSLPANGGPLRLDIRHLDIDQLGQLELMGEGSTSSGQFPAVDVTLENLFQGEQRLGELSFVVDSQEEVLTARNIAGELAHLKLNAERPGRLVWHRGEDGFTELQARTVFEDLGEVLEYFGYQRIIETSGGEFDFDVSWPGSPQDFSMDEVHGSMRVAIGDGSFPEAPSGAAGALRVVSILNLADIVRRLSLSDTFESGIPFYSVDGEIYWHGGVLEVARMDVNGGSSFQFSGLSDLKTQSLDGELVATLPVARNLPWIAALAASLPVAAGVFVVSKIFDKQMNRLSSAVYSIEGNWNDPQVRFDHIFDDTQRPTGKTAFDKAVQYGRAASSGIAGETQQPQEPALSVPAESGSP